MKKTAFAIVTALVMSLAACAMPASAKTPSSSPDYSAADFSGNWRVSSITTADGSPLDDREMLEIGAGFTLELLESGDYFVYDASGMALGQGRYSTDEGSITCVAGELQTVYAIEDADTLRCKSEDGSVTILSRQPVQVPEESAEGKEPEDDEPIDDDIENAPGDDDIENAPEDADAPCEDDELETDAP